MQNDSGTQDLKLVKQAELRTRKVVVTEELLAVTAAAEM